MDQLIEALEDPEQREVILERLKEASNDQESTTTISDSVVDEALDTLREQQALIGTFLYGLAGTLNHLPEFIDWFGDEMQKEDKRKVWVEVASRLLIVLFTGYLLRFLVRTAIARSVDSSWHHHPGFLLTRDLAGIVALGIGASLTLLFLHPTSMVLSAGTFVILGAVLSRSAVLMIAALLAPKRRFERLLPMRKGTAAILYSGLALGARVGILGHFLLTATRSLGLPYNLYTFVQHLLFLIVSVILIITVIRSRDALGQSIKGWSQTSDGLIKRIIPWTFLASYGHWIAVVWIVVHYLVWSLNIPGGTIVLSRATIGTVLVLAIGRLLLIGVDRMLHWGSTAQVEDGDLAEVQERASRYAGPLRFALRTTIIVLGLLALAQVWNLGILAWFETSTGSAVLATLLRLLLIVMIAVVLSEIAASLATRYIEATDDTGVPVHSNRSRTLASILRNVVIVAVVVTAAMIALSELGVNAGALLAGAGVIGLAIGFGSQRLVQDLITGLFILLGDAIRVGDVVNVANLAGVVESMSMRAVTLRSYDGNVHTVPYSSIDTVTNMTKDFSFAVLDIRVDYKEDIGQVLNMLHEVDRELRRAWPFRRQILAPLEIAGVEALAESAVIVRCRSKVRPGEQWGIRREFNYRIKDAFEKAGINIPFPQQTVNFTGLGMGGLAPPVIEQSHADLKQETSESQTTKRESKPG